MLFTVLLHQIKISRIKKLYKQITNIKNYEKIKIFRKMESILNIDILILEEKSKIYL